MCYYVDYELITHSISGHIVPKMRQLEESNGKAEQSNVVL